MSNRPMRRRRANTSITPAQLGAVAAVLAVFITGLVIGGVAGAILVGLLAVTAGAWLALRWGALTGRVRLVRAFAVVVALAVAVSLLWR
jgi:thiol:disulfide interchange protein